MRGMQGGYDHNVYKDESNGTVYIDVANVTPSDLVIKCGENKTMLLDESVYDDMSFPLLQGRQTALGKPDFDYTNLGFLFPQNDSSEFVIVRCQLKHTWKEGSTIFPHVHWRQKANQQVTFKIDYKWYNNGDNEPTDWSTLIMNENLMPYISGTISQTTRNSTGISGVGKKISSMLLIKLYRDDNTYTGDALVDDFDIHIEIDSLGSRFQNVK